MNKWQAAVTDVSLFYISCLCRSQLVTYAIRNIFSWRLVSNTESRYSLDDWYQTTELIKLPHHQKVLTLKKKKGSNIRWKTEFSLLHTEKKLLLSKNTQHFAAFLHILQEIKLLFQFNHLSVRKPSKWPLWLSPLYCLAPERLTQMLWTVFRMWVYKPIQAEGFYAFMSHSTAPKAFCSLCFQVPWCAIA